MGKGKSKVGSAAAWKRYGWEIQWQIQICFLLIGKLQKLILTPQPPGILSFFFFVGFWGGGVLDAIWARAYFRNSD
jgi:hypothetical protein